MIKIKKLNVTSEVFDLTTPKNHNFFANNLLVHNCAEIFLYADADTTAQCVLTSLPLQKFVNPITKAYDHDSLGYAVTLVVKSLNKVININKYTSDEAEKGGREQRALAIGVQGLADTFAMMDYTFTSDEAKRLNKEIFETIYYYALKASNQLVIDKVYDVCPVFEDSNFSKGILQFDMWNLKESDLSNRYDWYTLKESIKTHGVCNSMLTGLPPTASSASIIGSNEAFEPFNSNIYVRVVKGGSVTIVNKYLIEDLEAINMWTPEIRQQVIVDNGSVQSIQEIPEHIREKYKTAYELSQKELLYMSAERAPFIDQSQSLNIFMANPTVGKLTSSHFHAWRLGLKTGQYYLRSKSIEMKAKHLAIDTSTKTVEEPQKPSNSQFECFGCSS